MNWQSMKAGLRKSATQVLAGVALVYGVRAQDADPTLNNGRPLVQVDLRKYGYDTSSRTRPLHKFADYTDSSHLAVAWLTLDNRSGDTKAEPLATKPAHLHVLVLDVTTGQKVGAQAWPTPAGPVRFLGARDGKFLTCTGNVLRLFSSTFEVLREQDLPNEYGCLGQRPGWGISPSRRSLLISFYLGRGQGYQYTLLDAETFSVVARWTEPTTIVDMSDDWLLGLCGEKLEASVRRIDKTLASFPAGQRGQQN